MPNVNPREKRCYCLESDIRTGTYLFIYLLLIRRRYKRQKLCSPVQRKSLAFALRDRKAKAQGGAELQLPTFIISATDVSEWTPANLPQGKQPQYTMRRKLGGPHSRSELFFFWRDSPPLGQGHTTTHHTR